MTSQNKRMGRNHEQSHTWPSEHTEPPMCATLMGALAVWSGAIFSFWKAFNSQQLLKVVILKTKCRCSLSTNGRATGLGADAELGNSMKSLENNFRGVFEPPWCCQSFCPLEFLGISSHPGSLSSHPVWGLMPQWVSFCKLSITWSP